MARPRVKELTEREREVMHIFWQIAEGTVAHARDKHAESGRELAYTTVATLVRILTEKEFLEQVNDQRPFRFKAVRSFEEVSGSMVGDLVQRLFQGSREQLLLRLMEQRKLSAKERRTIEEILKEKQS